MLASSALGSWWHARGDLKAVQSWTNVDDRRVSFYNSFVHAGDLAFDIGANIGNRTKIFRRLGARVIALEPQPYCESILERAFRGDSGVVVLSAAAGRAEGTAEMKVASGHVVSSLAPEWIREVTKSKRFGDVSWEKSISCRLTTLDQLIATYGIPAFIKIDVEGYESEVIAGLSSPVGALSFEFTPEYKIAAFACIDMLAALGMVVFNYSSGESMEFEQGWGSREEMKAFLQKITDTRSFGDVYARLPHR
jgi:FkbM family methyltransferase